MAGVWRTVQVFISSTFRDMHAERDHLIKRVFPGLRERLEKYRVYLVDIDLRWGVTRQQAENERVLDLCLQKIDECRPFFIGILGERYGWVPDHLPADALKRHGWLGDHEGKSVTELEILHGVLQNPHMRRRAFFYVRDPASLQTVPETVRRGVSVETNPEQAENLAELKRKIRASGYPVMDPYPARWDPEAYDPPSRSKGRLVGLEEFGERVGRQLWDAIREELLLPDQPPVAAAADALAGEEDDHERFMESRLRVYVGREKLQDQLTRFAEGNDGVPCLVTGPSGSGKSAALARFVASFRPTHPDVLVIPHFIGASSASTNLRQMLRRFCLIIKEQFDLAEEVPLDTNELVKRFREFLADERVNRGVLFVIDALNQLDEADRAQEMYWLPVQLRPQVRIIVSCIADAGKQEPVLEAFCHWPHQSVTVDPLSDADRREIIRQVPSLSAKTLDDLQIGLLLDNPATANPLFLLVALEELRGFGSYEQLNARIATFPREGDTVTAIFTQVIERLEEEFNRPVVATVLPLLASARRGLSDRELLDLIEGAGIQISASQSDLFPVLRQLRPYLLSRAGLNDFYHRNLYKAARERYLDSSEKQKAAHVRLADYFHAQDYWLESHETKESEIHSVGLRPRPANQRKVDELAWQRFCAEQWEEYEGLLTDLSYLEAKAEADLVFELAAEFSAGLVALASDRPRRRLLRLLEEALRTDINFIARFPTTLFQCLWNRSWWYDCPQAAQHYDPPENGWPPEGPPWDAPGPKLYRLLESWRNDKEKSSPGFFWVRSLRPPRLRLGTNLLAVFRGYEFRSKAWRFRPTARA